MEQQQQKNHYLIDLLRQLNYSTVKKQILGDVLPDNKCQNISSIDRSPKVLSDMRKQIYRTTSDSEGEAFLSDTVSGCNREGMEDAAVIEFLA
jgi:hypothetical protein